MQKWLDAAERYDLKRQREEERIRKEQERLEAIQDATDELTTFMATSNGEAAIKLLRASGQTVCFAEVEEEQSGIAMHWILGGNGLVIVMEQKNVALGSANEPRITSTAVPDVVQAWAKDGMKEPSSLVPWLTAQLDQIADAAPTDI
jgi:hypothetical protein